MELGPQNHDGDGLLRPNSTIVVYMDSLGITSLENLEPQRMLNRQVRSCTTSSYEFSMPGKRAAEVAPG